MRLARGQEGLFAMWQAAKAGIARSTIGFWLEQGELRRVMHGIYQVRAVPVSSREEEAAIMLRYRLDTRVAFSHFSALAHFGVADRLSPEHHLTVPEGRRRHRKIPAVTFHSLPLRESDTVTAGIIRCTSPLLTLHDLAAWRLPVPELLRIHARMLRAGLVGRETLDLEAPETERLRGRWYRDFRAYLFRLRNR